MDYYDYIIDFERLNELTNPVGYIDEGFNKGIISPLSRRAMSKYVDYWQSCIDSNNFKDVKKITYIVNNLTNCGVLITPRDKRNEKLTEILK